MHKITQLLAGFYHLHGTQVDTTQHTTGLLAGAHIGLQWGLTIELDGQVDDIATLHQTVRRGIGPTTCDIDTHR